MAKNNSEYWEQRIASNTWKTYNSLEEKNRDLLELYQEASRNIRNELYDIAEKYSKDGVLSRTDMYRKNHLKKLEKRFEGIVLSLGQDAEKNARKGMQDGFQEVYGNTAVGMGDNDFSMPNKKLMEKLLNEPWRGSDFSSRLWKNQKKLATGLNTILEIGLQQGKTVTEMAVQLHNFMGQSFNACHRLVRSETMHYLNSATMQRYKDVGVEYVQIWAALDERTCEICGVNGYHSKVYPINKCPVLPFHPNCRCTIIPCFDDKLIRQYEKNTSKSGIIKPDKKFVESKNIKEAESFAVDVLGIPGCSYRGVDIHTANEWNRGLLDTFKKFPELKNNFAFVGECHERNKRLKPVVREYYLEKYKKMNPDLPAEVLEPYVEKQVKNFIRSMRVSERTFAQSYSPDSEPYSMFKGITVNRDWGGDSEEFISALKGNVKSKYHPDGCDTIRSVLDHEVGHQIDVLLDIRNEKVVQDLFEGSTQQELTNRLSRYSWDNNNPDRYSEMIAEAWSEYCNNPEPRKIAETIGQLIEEKYKRKFGG